MCIHVVFHVSLFEPYCSVIFLIFWLVYLFNVKRVVKRDLKGFKSRDLKDNLVRSRK